MFEYYTFLHHSQTQYVHHLWQNSLNTIRFYIILKLIKGHEDGRMCLNTIRFYIILKQYAVRNACLLV